MDSLLQLFRSLPDGPVFVRELEEGGGLDALVERLRSPEARGLGVRLLAIGSDPRDWLVLDLNPTTPDPAWRDVLHRMKGRALYAVACSWSTESQSGCE